MEYLGGATRIYRIGWGQRVFCIIFMGFSAFLLVGFWGGAISGAREANWIELVIPPVFLTVGGFLTVRAFKDFIALTESAIRHQTLFELRTLPFDRIRGRRRYLVKGDGKSPSVWHLKVESNDDQFPTLDFEESYYTFDEHFRTWFSGLTDLDERDKTGPKVSNFGLV
jgi:hypothetical protein